MGAHINVRLTDENTKQLEWLLEHFNKNREYKKFTTSDVIQLGVNNLFSATNVQLYEDQEEDECEPKWLERFTKN